MPKKNIPLLKRLRTRFLRMRHLEHFDQEAVARVTECGAAMCSIGHTLDLAGYKRRLLPEYKRSGTFDYEFFSPDGFKVREPIDTATELLGLSYIESRRLFLDSSIRTPKQAAERIERLISVNVPAR